MKCRDPQCVYALFGLVVIVGVVAVNGLTALEGCRPIVDEGPYHVAQIESLIQGRPDRVEGLTMPRTYHAVVAAVAYCHGNHGLDALRTISALLSLFSVPLFYLCMRLLSPEVAFVRTMQFLFLPVLFHIRFLVYTDAFAMVPTMCAVLAYLGRRYWLSGLFAALGVLTRQTHIACLAILFAMIYVDCYSWDFRVSRIVQHCGRCWTFTLGLVGFLCFFVLNGGVAIGDAAMHPAMPVNVENNCGFLLVYAAVFWPSAVTANPQVVAFIRRNLLLSGILVLTCANVFVFGFVADHPYNLGRTELLPRNYVLECFRESLLLRCVCVPVLWWALLFLVGVAPQRPSARLIYPVIAASLAFSWFVSPRYYLPGLAMLLMFRSTTTMRAEWCQAFWCCLVAVVLLLMTAWGKPIV